MHIKVCGNTRLDQVYQLDEMGVEFAGFIFYHKSPRYVVGKIAEDGLKKARLKINKVGVFVNSDYDEVMKNVEKYGLYMVQLHGDESPRLCERISDQVPIIKVFRIKEEDNVDWKIREYRDVSDLFLFDTDWHSYGGSGKKFDWKVLDNVFINKPFLLSGGIGIDEVSELKTFANGNQREHFFAVDVNSKLESSPGVKDMKKVKQFVDALR
ncbi:MAG TPA: phosphoribosylanthranilate isomerase [Agriterribacter sp.]|nr:phosphoribosylanthranilate isomerase [Chitinophagaceae bacterium]HRP32233.1 phosphoribosylanthranilate isomerase [Agriterribacter sp.]